MSQQPQQPVRLPVVDDLDPANQALSDALRRSFAILKWIMALTVLLYAFSGMFPVRPGEVGYVLRMGRILPTQYGEGWHFSWPFPIDEARTMSLAGERSVEASFLFQLTDLMKTRGISAGGTPYLKPGRDHYLVTGDLNILHARLIAQYRVTSAIDYLSNIYDSRRELSDPPEKPLLTDLLTASTIETAAIRSVDAVYKDRSGFLDAVAGRLNERLNELRQSGAPTGIVVQRVLATSFEGYEAVLPMLNVLTEFEEVQSSEQRKGQRISEARGAAERKLNETAGSGWAELAEAIDAEEVARVAGAANLAERRARTVSLLKLAGGDTQRVIKTAEAFKNQIVQGAAGDAERVSRLAADFRANPVLWRSRYRLAQRQAILQLPTIAKKFVPGDLGRVWLQIPRDPAAQERAAEQRALMGPGEIKPEERQKELELGPMQTRAKALPSK